MNLITLNKTLSKYEKLTFLYNNKFDEALKKIDILKGKKTTFKEFKTAMLRAGYYKAVTGRLSNEWQEVIDKMNKEVATWNISTS